MRRWLTMALVALLPATPAWADGDGPTRKMTGPEAAAYGALKSAVQEALPKVPANYTLAFGDGTGPGGFHVFEATRPDQAARMAFAATYTLSPEFRDAQQRDLYMDRAKGTPEQQAKIAALDAKSQELHQARDATRDRAAKDRIRAQIKAVDQEADQLRDQAMAAYQAWVASGGAAQAAQGFEKSLPAKELTVRVLVNQEVNLSDQAVPYKLQGFPLAFEQTQGCRDPGTSCITVFVGTFDKEKRVSGYTRYNPRVAGPGVPTKARSLAVVVAGPGDKPQSARDLLGQANLAALRALVP